MSERSGWQLAGRNVAEAYEHYIKATFGDAWTHAFIQLVAPAEGDRVLDVACGTGAAARYSAPLVGPTGRVVGLDLNPGMLSIARDAGSGGHSYRMARGERDRIALLECQF